MNLVRMGLFGAHRTGKTTLARHLSDTLGVPFVETRSSHVFERYGYTPNDAIPIETRLMIQIDVLSDAVDLWSSQTSGFVSDRTPIDMAAYMLAEINGAVSPTLSEKFHNHLGDYLLACERASNFFHMVMHVRPPLMKIADESGKAQFCPSYATHLLTLMDGQARAFYRDELIYTIPSKHSQLDVRKEAVVKAYTGVNDIVLAQLEKNANEEKERVTIQ